MNKRHYEHTLPNIRGSLSNTYNETERIFSYPIVYPCALRQFGHTESLPNREEYVLQWKSAISVRTRAGNFPARHGVVFSDYQTGSFSSDNLTKAYDKDKRSHHAYESIVVRLYIFLQTKPTDSGCYRRSGYNNGNCFR